MSAATLSTPARQPFGSVSQARLRNLTNTKNSQNALPTSTASPLKQAPTVFDHVDSENMDPMLFLSPSKTGKGFDFDALKAEKTPHFSLTTMKSPRKVELPSVVGQKRKAETSEATPVEQTKRRSEPQSAPTIPAGRSPTKSKRAGILSSRRRVSAVPFARLDSSASVARVPFSLNAALAGTVPLKPKAKGSSKGWHFQIYEDSPDDEMANIMEHSTCTLDISDDENRTSPKGDRDNKENVPPAGHTIAANGPVHRRDVMSDEARSPLGDLDAKEFYADGCDSTSVFIVPADEAELEQKGKAPVSVASILGTKDATAPASTSISKATISEAANDEEKAGEFQIWESESAKDENEDAVADVQDKENAGPSSLGDCPT